MMNNLSLTDKELLRRELETERDILRVEIDDLNATVTEELDQDIRADANKLSLDRDQHTKNFKNHIDNINAKKDETKITKGKMVEALRKWRKADGTHKTTSKFTMVIDSLIELYEKHLHEKETMIDKSQVGEIETRKLDAEGRASDDSEVKRELKVLEEIENKLEKTIETRDNIVSEITRTLIQILTLEEQIVKQETEVDERNRVLDACFDLSQKLNRNSQMAIYKSLPKLPSQVEEYQEFLNLEIKRIQEKILEIDPSISKEGSTSEDKSEEIRDQIEELWTRNQENYQRLVEVDNETNTLVTQREEVERAFKNAFAKMVDAEVEAYEAKGQLTFLSLKSDAERANELNFLYSEKERYSNDRNKAFDETMVHHHIVVKKFGTKKDEEEAIANSCYECEKEVKEVVNAQRALLLSQIKAQKSQLVRDLILRAMNPLRLKLEFLNRTLSSTA